MPNMKIMDSIPLANENITYPIKGYEVGVGPNQNMITKNHHLTLSNGSIIDLKGNTNWSPPDISNHHYYEHSRKPLEIVIPMDKLFVLLRTGSVNDSDLKILIGDFSSKNKKDLRVFLKDLLEKMLPENDELENLNT